MRSVFGRWQEFAVDPYKMAFEQLLICQKMCQDKNCYKGLYLGMCMRFYANWEQPMKEVVAYNCIMLQLLVAIAKSLGKLPFHAIELISSFYYDLTLEQLRHRPRKIIMLKKMALRFNGQWWPPQQTFGFRVNLEAEEGQSHIDLKIRRYYCNLDRLHQDDPIF
jgi:hypothetical protein